MSLFKRAFARGVNDELIRLGRVRYPTKQAADAIADAVGDQMPVEPAAEEVPAEVAADVATTLVESANQLLEATGTTPGEPMIEEAAKESAAADIDTRAGQQALAVMQKAAAETEKAAMGSTIEGGDKGNDLAQAVQGEAVMENKNRPQGMHVTGVGNTAMPVGAGTVGTETLPAPNAPGETGNTDANSVIHASKMGSVLQNIIQKVAMGSTIQGGDKGNKLDQAGAVTGEGALEAARRPEGYAVTGVGNTEFPLGAGSVGTEVAHPDQPGAGDMAVPGPANSVTAWSAANKSASDNAYVQLFRKTAHVTAPFLPNMTDEAKVAHVRQMMGMNTTEQAGYVGMLHKEAGASDDDVLRVARNLTIHSKTAGKMPEALKEKVEELEEKTEGKEGEKKEKKDEKKDSEMAGTEMPAKSASADLLARIRQVANQTLASE